MAKFMYRVHYSQEGIAGTVSEGFADREAYIRGLLEGMGATVESMNWAFGDDDAYIIFDGEPSAAIGGSLAAAMGGVGRISTVQLLSAAEMDAGAAAIPDYRAPGQ